MACVQCLASQTLLKEHSSRRPGPFSPIQLLAPHLLQDQTDKEQIGYKRAACASVMLDPSPEVDYNSTLFFCFALFLKQRPPCVRGSPTCPHHAWRSTYPAVFGAQRLHWWDFDHMCDLFFVFQGKQDAGKIQPFGWNTPEVQVNQSKNPDFITTSMVGLTVSFFSGLMMEKLFRTWKLCWPAKARISVLLFGDT